MLMCGGNLVLVSRGLVFGGLIFGGGLYSGLYGIQNVTFIASK